MKRLTAVILTVLLLGILVGCSNTNPMVVHNNESTAVSETEQHEESEVSEQEEETEIKIGDTIVTEHIEISIKNVELTYDVLPEKHDGFYTHYAADPGKVYISISIDVTNTSKQNISCDEIGSVIADYNNGYTYHSFTAVEDSVTGFTYANITDIDPLDTQGLKFIVECPQEVEETEQPLFLTFKIDGKKFRYTIR